ncbi:protein ALP1-like [Brachypodium distachyon]|uniref:protein ALP1-like n=1 Tax=Brachypodium distachyon TaxID=15368 RepID=UPI000234F67B|nr:protein ALP1-like [Brachypodium distachyon]|eukprot:XP_003572253.1 protein ALP1-like [Brachypodium distachyon]
MSSDCESDDDSYEIKRRRVYHHAEEISVMSSAAATIAGKYCEIWVMKAEPRKSILSGFGWLQETIDTPGETYAMLRMNVRVFFSLHDMLVSRYDLQATFAISSYESLAIFLWILGGCESNRRTQNRFKHSGDTIHHKFHEVLLCVIKMAAHYLKPKDPNFHSVHPTIRNDRMAFPHLKDCIGAIDGTHIRASIPADKKIRYVGRSDTTTQNVLAICDFDMHFTYASIGQPGSMHDTSVLYHALEKDKDTFSHPPKGKYYLVDADYPNRPGYLAPYKGERYHVPDFYRGAAPNTPKEKFNKIHSSKRNAIERAFGVLKNKWQILLKMPNYPIEGQKMIVAAAMTLHNYVRYHHKGDLHFVRCDRDPNYVPTIPLRYRRYAIPASASDASTSESSAPDMDRFRDELATAIAQGWRGSL